MAPLEQPMSTLPDVITAGPRRRVLVVFNPVAGRRRRPLLERALSEMSRSGAVATLRETTASGDAERFAREARRTDFDLIVAAGGDGTINEVINGWDPGSPPLGVLPLGTANVLAAEIGASGAVASTVADLLNAPERAMWPGVVNGRRFAMMAGIGFDAGVVDGVDIGMKRRLGKGAYIVEATRRLLANRQTAYDLIIDGETCTAASAIFCRGSRYGGPYVFAPRASVFEPRFEVCLFTRGQRTDIVRAAASLWLGRAQNDPNLRTLTARHIRVTGSDDPVQCDGTIICRLPAEFTISSTPVALVAR